MYIQIFIAVCLLQCQSAIIMALILAIKPRLSWQSKKCLNTYISGFTCTQIQIHVGEWYAHKGRFKLVPSPKGYAMHLLPCTHAQVFIASTCPSVVIVNIQASKRLISITNLLKSMKNFLQCACSICFESFGLLQAMHVLSVPCVFYH